MALWVAFIGLGMTYLHYKVPVLRYAGLGVFVFSAVYFVLITGVVMPAISNNGQYPHFHYAVLGSNSKEALFHQLSHPIDSFYLLFVNHSGIAANDFVKAECWIVVMTVGIICFLRKPIYFLMLVPIFFQKLYHDNSAMWGINQHYAVEFAPLLAIGTFEAIGSFRKVKAQRMVALIAVVLSLASAVRVMDNTVAYAEKARIRVYKAAHYSREFPVKRAYEVLDLIPDDAVVSAQSSFVPKLALRESVYQFPIVRDASYILLSPADNPYPITPEVFQQKTDSLLNSTAWKIVVKEPSFILLKKN